MSEAKITQLNVEKSKILDSDLSNESKEVKEIENKIVKAAEDIKKYQVFSTGNAASVAEKRQKIEQLYKKFFEEKLNKLPIRRQLNELNIAKEQNNKTPKFKANIIVENKAQKAVNWINIPDERNDSNIVIEKNKKAKKYNKLSEAEQSELQIAIEKMHKNLGSLKDLQGNDLDIKEQLAKQPAKSSFKKPQETIQENSSIFVENNAQELVLKSSKNKNLKIEKTALNNFTKLKNDLQHITMQTKKQVGEFLDSNLSKAEKKLSNLKKDAIAIGKQIKQKV